MSDTDSLTYEDAKSLLSYDKQTGVVRWRSFVNNACRDTLVAGSSAGHKYVRVRVRGRQYYAHRLAFLLVTGEWPNGFVDHIDGNKLNNSWSNLRDVSQVVNQQNIKARPAKSSDLPLGVYLPKDKRRYKAQIRVNGKRISIGYFDTAEQAGAAYLDAKRRLHAGCTI